EFVEGAPITEFCVRQLLGRDEKLRILKTVCEAVQHAHLKGVIHRDIKPSNILVTEIDGRSVPKVIDFGIALALDVSLTNKTLFTEVHQVVGTPSYMSPEQATLDGSPLDGRSDIYTLGVLIYETLTGVQPFSSGAGSEKSVLDVLRRVTLTDPPPMSHYDPNLRGDVEWVVGKAMAKDPDDRYDSAGSLARELERILDNQPVQAAAPSRWYRWSKFAKRHRTPVLAGALATLALLTGAIVSTVQYVRASALSQDLQHREIELRHEFRDSDFKLAQQLAARRRPADAIAYFCRALRTDPDHHASASCLLALLTHQRFNKELFPAAAYPEDVVTNRLPAVFGNEPIVLGVSELESREESISVWRLRSGEIEFVPTNLDASVKFLVPASESRFAIADTLNLHLRESVSPADSVHALKLESPITSFVADARWKVVACGCEDGSIHAWNVESGELIVSEDLADSAISALAIGREGTLIGYGTSAGAVGIRGLRHGFHAAKSGQHQTPITALALPPSGSHLVSGDAAGQLHIWRAQRLTPVAAPIYHGDAVRVLRINAAYRKVMSGSADGYARLWEMTDGSLSPPAQFHNKAVTFGELTPNSAEFITGGDGGALRIWSALDGSGEALIGGAQTSAVSIDTNQQLLAAFSDSRRRLALFEISRAPAQPMRIRIGETVDLASFSEALPKSRTASAIDLEVRLLSNFSLNGGIAIRTLRPITAWNLNPKTGQVAALTAGNRLQIWDAQTGEELSPLMRLRDDVTALRFGEVGDWLELLLVDGSVATLDIPPMDARLPAWFLEFAEQVGGKRLDDRGVLRNLSETSLQHAAELIPSAVDPEFEAAWRCANWFVANLENRTMGPNNTILVRDYVQQLLESGESSLVREALRLDPRNPGGIEFLKQNAGPNRGR
ncbi:MAG: WD40 repeat domain-containing serine/threonine protein kinase, partial [Verrucomicrobiota bacterium]